MVVHRMYWRPEKSWTLWEGEKESKRHWLHGREVLMSGVREEGGHVATEKVVVCGWCPMIASLQSLTVLTLQLSLLVYVVQTFIVVTTLWQRQYWSKVLFPMQMLTLTEPETQKWLI